MKNVAKCDTWCELQNPVNHRVFERKLRPRDPPEGTPASWALEAHPRSDALPRALLDADAGPPSREMRWAEVYGRRMGLGAASGGLLRTSPPTPMSAYGLLV